jgi:hypothetical protein
MAVTDWLDEISRLFEVSDGRGGTLKTYKAFEKSEFPEALSIPCVLTYAVSVTNEYSQGGPCIDAWDGVCEFHLTEDTSKAKYPYIMQFFARIRDASASDIQLGGRVSWFLLRTDQPSIVGPVVMQYGSEAPHLGLMVYWQVKESVSGDFTVSA